MSVGLIYRYFASKEELFLSVCQAQSDLQLNELAAVLSGIADPHTRLDAAVRFFVDSLIEDGWGAIIIHAQAEADRNPRLRDMLTRISDQQRGFSAMFIRELIARGEAPADMDVDSASLAVALLLHGAVRASGGTRARPGIPRPWSVPSRRSSRGRWPRGRSARARLHGTRSCVISLRRQRLASRRLIGPPSRSIRPVPSPFQPPLG